MTALHHTAQAASNKRRIAHVITRFIRGGAEENTILTCQAQAAAGHEVFLVVGREWHEDARQALGHGVQFCVVSSMVRRIRPLRDMLALFELIRLFRRLKPEIVHTHESKAGILGRLAAKVAGVPYIVHGVHIVPFAKVSAPVAWLYMTLERLCGSFTQAFLYVSPDMRETYRARRIGRNKRHEVVQSGMDIDRFRSPAPPEDAEELLTPPCPMSGQPFVILSLAALEPRKGHVDFLPVFSRIAEKRPNVTWLIAGSGRESAAILRTADRLGLAQHIRILGFRTDPECLLAIADVLLISSRHDGLPRASVQAALAGVPIVSTALAGLESVMANDEEGFIVPVGDLESMEAAIIRLMDDPELRSRFRRNLRRRDYTAWSSEAMAKRVNSIYGSVQMGRP